MYVYIDRIWRWMTYKGWYAIKPKQPTNQPPRRPDQIKINKIQKTCRLVNFDISANHKAKTEENGKSEKYL